MFLPGCAGDQNLEPRSSIHSLLTHSWMISESISQQFVVNKLSNALSLIETIECAAFQLNEKSNWLRIESHSWIDHELKAFKSSLEDSSVDTESIQYEQEIESGNAIKFGWKEVFIRYEKRFSKRDLMKMKSSKRSTEYERELAKELLREMGLSGKNMTDEGVFYSIQVWMFKSERLVIVMLSGEPVIDYAFAIKSEIHKTWIDDELQVIVTGYASDISGYIPSDRVLKEGGYESGDRSAVLYGNPSRFSIGIESHIVSAVLSILNKLLFH